MSDLDALLAGIVATPHEAVRWLIVADWLDDHGQSDRAELLRLHRMLIDTCCEPDQHPERATWQARIVELIDAGVKPVVPQHTLMLPGGVPLVGNFIPPGSFLMGGGVDKDEMPIHRVTITKGFFMGIYPVTQVQWVALKGNNPSEFVGENLPVSSVNWDEALEFCANVNALGTADVRLPTEAQWEYACRAGTTTHYHFGDVPSAARMNYDASGVWGGSVVGVPRQRTTEVSLFAANSWGLHDCHGNVSERCADWDSYDYYSRGLTEDPDCQDGEMHYRVLRGGNWFDFPHSCRAACRGGTIPVISGSCIGFRVAFTLT